MVSLLCYTVHNHIADPEVSRLLKGLRRSQTTTPQSFLHAHLECEPPQCEEQKSIQIGSLPSLSHNHNPYLRARAQIHICGCGNKSASVNVNQNQYLPMQTNNCLWACAVFRTVEGGVCCFSNSRGKNLYGSFQGNRNWVHKHFFPRKQVEQLWEIIFKYMKYIHKSYSKI